jgi:hypothetical protein
VISVKTLGDFKDTTKFLEFMQRGDIYKNLDRYGHIGVDALSSATPRDTGKTAESWGFQTGKTGTTYAISWYNTCIEGGVNVAVIIQYGHGTRNGGYIRGIDYINPAIRPVFEKILDDVWKQVRNA